MGICSKARGVNDAAMKESEDDMDSGPWSIVTPDEKSLLKSNLKRKKSTESLDLLQKPTTTCKKSNISNLPRIDNNTSEINLYAKDHKGPAYAAVNIKREVAKQRNFQNLLLLAKLISALNLGVEELIPQGQGKVEIKFKSGEQANYFVLLESLPEKGISAYIPRYRTERRGIVKSFDIDLDINDIITHSVSPCAIKDARRLNRKVWNKDTGKPEWSSSETALLTFEETVLPDDIKMYHLINKKVEVYIEPIKTCFICFKYGHVTKRCKGNTRCRTCGQLGHSANSCQSKEHPSCLHCKEDHPTFNSKCKVTLLHKEINNCMVYMNISAWEARKLTHESRSMTLHTPVNIESTKENFPPIQPVSQAKTMAMKSIGGQEKQKVTINAWKTIPSPNTKTSPNPNTKIPKTKNLNRTTNNNTKQLQFQTVTKASCNAKVIRKEIKKKTNENSISSDITISNSSHSPIPATSTTDPNPHLKPTPAVKQYKSYSRKM